MLIVFVVVFILLIILASIGEKLWYWDVLSTFIEISSIILLSVTIIIGIFLTVDVASESAIKADIEMYVEENEVIETQIDTLVKDYMKYESETFDKVSDKNAMAVISLYPELNSDTLVQKQIETYVANTNKIKELKSNLNYIDVYKWWLYFGGN